TPPGSDPPAVEQNELPERWSASRKTELVLRLLRGEAQGEESESYHRAGIVSGSGPIDQPLACRPWFWRRTTCLTWRWLWSYTAFAAKVKEKSAGRMEIRIHPASSLYPSFELLPALLDGRSEIGTVLASYLTDVLLEIGPLELPFMTGSVEEHRKAALQLRPFYAEMFAKKGL